MFTKEQNSLIREIAERFNNGNQVNFTEDKLTKKDVFMLGDYDKLYIKHPKGFNIRISRCYALFMLNDIPQIKFVEKYKVEDEVLGTHPIDWTLENCIEYVNGLLGH